MRPAGARRLPAPRAARGPRARAARRAARAAARRDDDRDQLVARRAGPRGARFAERYNAAGLRDARDAARGVGWDEVGAPARRARRRRAPTRRSPRRRAAAFGPAIDPLFYADAVAGRARRGRLDHRHRRPPLPRRLQQRAVRRPRATRGSPRRSPARAGCSTPTRATCTRARSSSPSGCATCPPELDTVLLVNSGSEANDLAWRIAPRYRPRGGLCTAVRLPRHHRGDRRAVARGLAGRRAARARRDVASRPTPTAAQHLDAAPFAAAVAAAGRPRRSAAAILDGLSPATASPTSTRLRRRTSDG